MHLKQIRKDQLLEVKQSTTHSLSNAQSELYRLHNLRLEALMVMYQITTLCSIVGNLVKDQVEGRNDVVTGRDLWDNT